MATMIDVPERGRRWVMGALVRDGMTLYRIAGKPVRYHSDALPMQRVAKVRDIPESWQVTQRIVEIMEMVRRDGLHTPDSRGVTASDPGQPAPRVEGEKVQWLAREERNSYASYPYIEVCGDRLLYVEPIYDDAPIVKWMVSAELAEEARKLIAQTPDLTRYPSVHVHTVSGSKS